MGLLRDFVHGAATSAGVFYDKAIDDARRNALAMAREDRADARQQAGFDHSKQSAERQIAAAEKRQERGFDHSNQSQQAGFENQAERDAASATSYTDITDNDGNIIAQREENTQKYLPLSSKVQATFEPVYDGTGNLVGQRNTKTNEFKPHKNDFGGSIPVNRGVLEGTAPTTEVVSPRVQQVLDQMKVHPSYKDLSEAQLIEQAKLYVQKKSAGRE